MSSLPIAFAPLPGTADPGAAFTDVIRASSPFVNNRILFTVPGEYFYYPLSLDVAIVTSGAVPVRSVLLIALDANGQEMYRQPTSTTQPAGIGYNYIWQVTVGAGYGDTAANFSAPMPPRLLEPGMRIGIQVNNVDAADTGAAILSVIKIPRQRPRVEIVPAVALPRLV